MPIRDAIPADALVLANIHVESWRTTYRGLLPERLLADLSYAGRERQWAWAISAAGEGDGCVVVAEDAAAGVVGFASGGRCRGDWPFDGELTAIYLAAAHQGRGLGRDLVRAVAGRLAAQGHRSLLLWVLRTNAPARGFYEALGGALVGEKTEEFAGATLHEVAYGWPDLTLLQASTRRTT